MGDLSRGTTELLSARGLALELGVVEWAAKRRPTYPLPPPAFPPLLTALRLGHIGDAHLLENWWRFVSAYPRLICLTATATQVPPPFSHLDSRLDLGDGRSRTGAWSSSWPSAPLWGSCG